MKRAVICVTDPWTHLAKYPEYSLMIVNPNDNPDRKQYLLDNADWSLLVTNTGETERDGNDYGDESLVLYTSGTTGDSKFYGFTKDKVKHVTNTVKNNYNLTSNDRYLSVMPLWHAHGLLMYLSADSVGAEIKITNVPALKHSIDYQPTYVSAIPDILKLMTRQNFTDLRFVRTASSALPNALYQNFVEHFNVPVVEAFGMTETCSHCFTNPLDGEQRPGTIGLPAGIEAKIINGHLHLRSPATYTQEWFDTQDLAEQDSAGYYRLLGRAVDRINIRGYKIDPLSIENQLHNRLPDIGEVCVFGDDRLMCIYTGDIDPVIIKQELVDINYHCTPKFVKRVDSIQKNNAGKISRTLLTELYR